MPSSTKITTGMILAAGFGTRLQPITLSKPKALVEVGGIPMLQRIINQFKTLGITKIIINTHYLAEQIEQYVKNIKDVEILLSYEPIILDTGGGILNAMRKFNVDTILAVNCDCLLRSENANPLSQLLDNWDEKKMEMLLLLQDKNTASLKPAKEDFNLNNEGKIIWTEDERKFIFTGAYVVNRSFFKDFNGDAPFSITKLLFKSDAGQYPYYGIVNKYNWIDIGSIEALEVANKNCANIL